MTDEKQKELGLTNRQRILYEYFEDHPGSVSKIDGSFSTSNRSNHGYRRPVLGAIKPLIDTLVPIIAAMPVEVLIDDEEDPEDD